MVFETHPGDKRGAEGEVEESFVGYGQDDEDGREGEEDDDEAVEVVVVWLEAVEEGYGKRCDQDCPPDHLVTQRQTHFSLQRRHARSSNDHGQHDQANLNSEQRS